jgi:hypothetical protein
MKFEFSYTNPFAPGLSLVFFLVTSSKAWDVYWKGHGLLASHPSPVEEVVVAAGAVGLGFLAVLAAFLSLSLVSSLFLPMSAKPTKEAQS